MTIRYEARVLDEDDNVIAQVSSATVEGLEEELSKLQKIQGAFNEASRETSTDQV